MIPGEVIPAEGEIPLNGGAEATAHVATVAVKEKAFAARRKLLKVDKFCRLAFPAAFTAFNVGYMLYYSGPSREQLEQEGFIMLER